MEKNLSSAKRLEGKNVVVIGAGFGGLAVASYCAKAGANVTVVEKNEQPGGRASQFSAEGFTFDMGPSWYLMPDIFEHFFHFMGTSADQELTLKKLTPSYRIYFEEDKEPVDITGDRTQDEQILDRMEPGAGAVLKDYLRRSEEQYTIAKERFIYKNYNSIFDFFTLEIAKAGLQLSVFSTMQRYVQRFFKDPRVQKIMQYPLVFLGSSPYNAPALYNIMSHIDFDMGVYYPQGGIYEITKALTRIAKRFGTNVKTNAEVTRIITEGNMVTSVTLKDGTTINADIVINNADPAFTDQHLLPKKKQLKSDRYWRKRTLAPSAFILYLGFNKKLPNLEHHTLSFSTDWKKNFGQIFDDPAWPENPSYYACAPSKTDPSVAPAGKENVFILVPIASGLHSDDAHKQQYAEKIINHLGGLIDEPDLAQHIAYQRIFSVEDFESRYNSYQGTALGLAHTLTQTAVWRPNNIHPKLKNLYYVGGNTNPGIGMPMCLVSAELVYKRLIGDTSDGPLSSEPQTPLQKS